MNTTTSRTGAGVATARERVILALDAPDVEQAAAILERVRGHVGAIKVGKELFTAAGVDAVRMAREAGVPVFLDLKYHDIPNTVAGAVRAAAGLGVRWLTVHTAGGAAMLEAAAHARDAAGAGRLQVLGVTVLTSEAGVDPEEVVERALLAQRSGLDGVIASPQEARRIRAACGPDFWIITPGVRPAGAAVGDQARVATPGAAIRDGASALVVGRPITAAPDPAAAADAIVAEVAAALGEAPANVRGVPDGTVPERLRRMLLDSQALLEGHFLLSSGLHSDRYVQCAKLLQHPRYARHAGRWLAERLRTYEPQVVVGVALGGLVIGQEVAAALGVRAVFVERDDGGTMQLRRGFALEPGERAVIVDDVCTRGGSIVEAAAVVRALGARAAVAASIIDRSGGKHTLDMPLEALLQVSAEAWTAAECPQCATGSPVVKPGSRKLA